MYSSVKIHYDHEFDYCNILSLYYVFLFTGKYDVCLPQKSCPSCSAEWTPDVKDLLRYRYWPATSSCQTLYKVDVFSTFEHMKLTAPAMSRQAFLKMLEHRSVQAGRVSLLE